MTTHIWQNISGAPKTPIVLSVPHAGRVYPEAMRNLARMDAAQLQPLEDRYADSLIASAISDSHQALVCRVARAWIDLNRAEDELDPAMFLSPRPGARPSAKVRGGLGLVPRRIAAGDIWRAGLDPADLEARLDAVHRPYHDQISTALDNAITTHGIAILLDIHSMPSLKGDSPPHIVVGNLYGRSCAPDIVDCAMHEVRATGLRVALNAPYAGGYVLERHGQPHRGIHALQIEVDRKLYLDTASHHPGPGMATMQQFVRRLAMALADQAVRRNLPLAAE